MKRRVCTWRAPPLQPRVAQLQRQGGVGPLVLPRQAQSQGAAVRLVVVQVGAHL